jgi:hypothetical protein
MKKVLGLGFVLGVLALALSIAPATADPNPPPNDNVCICHNTQHHQNNQGNANANQKVVIICVDPHSNRIPAHTKHGDAVVTSPGECGVLICDEETGPFPECCNEFPSSCV